MVKDFQAKVKNLLYLNPEEIYNSTRMPLMLRINADK